MPLNVGAWKVVWTHHDIHAVQSTPHLHLPPVAPACMLREERAAGSIGRQRGCGKQVCEIRGWHPVPIGISPA
eukprot:1569851-Rhodomonas_salina.3